MKNKIPVIILLIIIDQIIKLLIVGTIGVSGESITIIPNFIALTFVQNLGAAFGLFSARLWLICLDLLIIFAILKFIRSEKYEKDELTNWGVSLILAGGIGNLIDRVCRGSVVDYIDITKLFNWPVFNLADIYIVIGVILVFVLILVKTIKDQEKANEGV